MHALALHLEASVAHGTKRALLGLSHCCLLLVVPRRVELRSVGYRPTALTVVLQDRELVLHL